MKKKFCLKKIRKNNKQRGRGGFGIRSGVGGRWGHCKNYQKPNKWKDVYYNP